MSSIAFKYHPIYLYFFSVFLLHGAPGSSAASGNWGLLDQEAVLKWTQENIANFGGDPHEVTLAADRGGADVASIHLFAGAVDSGLFKKALLMVSSIASAAFGPTLHML